MRTCDRGVDMRLIINYFKDFLNMIPTIGIVDVIDIVVVAFLIYKIITMIHSSVAARITRSIVLLLIMTWVVDLLNMHAMRTILDHILELGLVALMIVFQPELRRVLERFGTRSLKDIWQGREQEGRLEPVIAQVINACELMSRERVGALIVFERQTSVEEYFRTGTVLNADVSVELIRNIFFPKASLHDGAMMIQDGTIAAAGCVLPLSENTHLSSDLGTRHRAGIGMSEVSDAVVVIVSEETGIISVAVGGMLKRQLTPQMLEQILISELIPNQQTDTKLAIRQRKKVRGKGDNNGKT